MVAVTTRAPRPGDPTPYRHVTKAAFAKYEARDELAVMTQYRGERYGILRADLQDAIDSGRLAVLTLAPDSVASFAEKHSKEIDVVSVFLDAEDTVLNERILQRSNAPDAERRARDRTFSRDATYTIQSVSLPAIAQALQLLVASTDKSGLLPHQWIVTLLNAGLLLEDFEIANVQAASYDLSLGDEYFYGGRVKRLSASKPMLTIEPYDYAIVTSKERARLPRDIAGRFGVSVGLFSQGVVLSNGPQIDPGFEGSLFCLLLNTSSSPVLLRRGQHYATLEFQRILEPSDRPYAGARQGKQSILDYLPNNAARGAINELKRELEQLRKDTSRLQTFFIAALSLMFAFAALLAATR